jgi:Zn-dependent peptidase ImmA (M78 family)
MTAAPSKPVTDPRAHTLRAEYHARFHVPEFPVPVEQIAEDVLGLAVEESDEIDCSGILLPAERRILIRANESEPRKRFTLAHELGHWVCQVMEGKVAPVFCRAQDVTLDPDAKALEREANVFAAELLMPEGGVRPAWTHTWDIGRCATRFGASTEAMHWRLFSFGLVAEPPR